MQNLMNSHICFPLFKKVACALRLMYKEFMLLLSEELHKIN